MFMQDIARQTAHPLISPLSSGLIAGTLIETETGWRDATTLRIGDLVHTHDGGLRPIRAVQRDWLHPGPATRLIKLPGGCFDNCDDVWLLAAQPVLVDHPRLITALIPAEALISLRGAQNQLLQAPVELITPVFDEPEGIWAASGLRLHCPGLTGTDWFTHLTRDDARTLLAA
jgi:hypothetical protein